MVRRRRLAIRGLVSWGKAILWCATLAALGLALKSIYGDPPPIAYAVGALVLYLGILVVLVLFPQLEAFGDYLWRVPAAKGLVALTFDDGPDPKTTPRVLDILAQRKQLATFFVLGWKVDAYPDLVRRIHASGHQLALHGYHHDRLYSFKTPRAVQQDIERCQDAVERAAGVRPVLFRPPIGQASPRTFAGARRAGVELVGWSVRSGDGLRWMTSEAVAARVIPRLEGGAIVLLHDAPEHGTHVDDREPASLAALPPILDALAGARLRSGTVEQLIGAAIGAAGDG
jgi:peptidoglycan-N-acetylglucosamine deacetylase